MDLLGLLVVLAAISVVVSLVSGISSMATDGQIGHRSSAQWMNWRVGLQALAVVLLMLALLGKH